MLIKASAMKYNKTNSYTISPANIRKMQIWPILLSAALLLPGCRKYLEQVPDNRTELNSPDKVSQLLSSAYPGTDYITFCEAMSDNSGFRNKSGGDLENENPYLFKDFASSSLGTPDQYWGNGYEAIAAANQALEACNGASVPNAYAPYKGEALVARAYIHFMLVTFFARAYDPATAAADPGIPYVLEPEKTLYKQYERNTVAYVYEMIEKDITEGIPLLDDKAYKIPAFHFNNAAAHTFASRFYLFKRQYDKVIEHAGKALSAGNPAGSLRPLNTTYRRLAYGDLLARYTSSEEKANFLLAGANALWARGARSYKYGLNSAIADDLYYGSNATGGSWAYNLFSYGSNPDRQALPKFLENFVETGPGIGYAYIYIPLLSAEEALFNRAEANVMLGNFDAALSDLNAFASTRIKNYNSTEHNLAQEKIKAFYSATDLKDALIRTILDFKRVEFMQEGLRWLDILRHRLPVTHAAEDGSKIEITADDPRKVLQIPQSAQREGIPPNPR
jgi:hypothetical protein